MPVAPLTCASFPSQAVAQAAFDADRVGHSGLDADGDGVACEGLATTSTPGPAAASVTAKPLSIDLDPDAITAGQPGRVWVAGRPGETVLLYATAPTGPARLVHRGPLNGGGLTSFVVRPTVTTRYDAHPDKGPGSRNSSALTLQVRGAATPPPATDRPLAIDLDPDAITQGQWGRVWVAGKPGEVVLLYATTNGQRKLVRRGPIDSRGLTSFVVRPGVDTQLQAHPDKGPSTRNSATLTLSVRQPAAPPRPVRETVSMQNAVEKARDYLEFTAFSRTGLIRQLEYEGFSTADATYAVDKVSPDWNQQAVEKARDYLELTSFSRDGLIRQLEYEGFTPAQAAYGATAVGL